MKHQVQPLNNSVRSHPTTNQFIKSQYSQSQQRAGSVSSGYQSRQQFSFNKIPRSHDRSLFLQDKYADIYNDLRIMTIDDIVEILLQQLEQNQRRNKQIQKNSHRITGLQDQLSDLRMMLAKKRQAITLLCQNQSKNIHMIQKLENKIAKKNDYGRDTYYEKKYQQLSIYMNEYIRNINTAQEQFKRVYAAQKSQNSRLVKQVQQLTTDLNKVQKKLQVQYQKYRHLQISVMHLSQNKEKITAQINMMNQQNQILRKQIQIFQENIRITDRLQLHHISKQQHQLSSQLDFIRQKINENNNISKDIIQKLQESSSQSHATSQLQGQIEKVNKDKQKIYQSLQRAKDKKGDLQKQVTNLKIRNQQLQQDISLLNKQLQFVKNQRDQLDDDLMQEKLQKQSIRKQLLGLADKVRLMQSTYKKQIQQSQKIKGQLFKFWENKEKKQSAVKDMSNGKILSQVKLNNDISQTTISISQKQSKLSLWYKKSEKSLQEISLNLNEKQNKQNDCSKDSLCE